MDLVGVTCMMVASFIPRSEALILVETECPLCERAPTLFLSTTVGQEPSSISRVTGQSIGHFCSDNGAE